MKKIFPSWGVQPGSSAPTRSQPSSSTRGNAVPTSSGASRRPPPGSTFMGFGGKVGSGGKGLGKSGMKRHRYDLRHIARTWRKVSLGSLMEALILTWRDSLSSRFSQAGMSISSHNGANVITPFRKIIHDSIRGVSKYLADQSSQSVRLLT